MIKRRKKKQRISADGTPYSIWQTRTYWLCIALIAWAVLELSVGIGLFSLSILDIFHFQELVPTLSVGPATIANGVVNLVVALLGLWGAYNPKRLFLACCVGCSIEFLVNRKCCFPRSD